MVKKVVRRRQKADNSGLFVPAGLFIGLAYGAMSGNWAAGVLGGLGFGFLAMAIAYMLGR